MKIAFCTLGCKVNQYETQAMMALMAAAGFETVPFSFEEKEQEAIVINSCTVTGESDHKLQKLLRRCRRDYPQAVLVLTGCMPQAFPAAAEQLLEADIVLGNAARRALPRHMADFLTHGQRIVDIPPHSTEIEPLEIASFQGRTRAFVKIEDGCDRFCSYCIIPYARGRVRSKPPEALRREITALAQGGYCEVVLVGINLTAYGQEWGLTIADAVELACGIAGIARVRLGSLEPDALTPEVIARLAAQPRLCPQFHLSLQSGCDATLQRMNRLYTTAAYADVCAALRNAFARPALTTDVMVGFPGEDENAFAQSLAFVRRIGFAKTHVFSYSPREGTPAAVAPAQVSAAQKAARSRRMIDACALSQEQFAAACIGETVEVLLETSCRDGMMEGHTPAYVPVRVRTPESAGTTVSVRVTAQEKGLLTGIPCMP